MRAPLVVAAVLAAVAPLGAQQDTRAQVQAMQFAPLRFQPPTPKRLTVAGVPVMLLPDRTLPTLSIQIRSRRGVAHLPDSLWGVGWQADNMLRTGGTTRLTPDSLDRLIEFYALQVNIFTDNDQSGASVSGLARYRDQMLDLLFDMMRNPRNDSSRVRITAAQQEETWRRRNDQPGSVLNRAWAQVMRGDHPLGRSIVKPEEIAGFTPARFRWVQERLFCPQQLLIGVSGDYDERALLAKLETLFRGWAACAPGLRDIPAVEFPAGPKLVYVEKDVNQTSIRMGHAGSVRVANTPEYFASQVADFVLGGSGFTSRMLNRVRSDSGFAYSAFTSWGAEPDRDELFFAQAQIRAEKTVAGLKLMRHVIASMAAEPPGAGDVKLAQDNEVNSFVFRFESASQIIGQQLGYALDGLPANWFDLYLRGIQAVTPAQVKDVTAKYLHADRLVTVIVGKSSAFDRPLAEVGEVTVLPVDGIRR